jgi:hypothetical protein
MIISVVWTKRSANGKLDIDGALDKLAQALTVETDTQRFIDAYNYATNDTLEITGDGLNTFEGLKAMMSMEKIIEAILVGYRIKLQEVEDSFSRDDVTWIGFGPLLGYCSGGMDWGGESDSASLWRRAFWDYDNPSEGDANPYGDLCYQALFVESESYAVAGQELATVTISVKQDG